MNNGQHSASDNGLAQENARLRQRVAELEAQLAQQEHAQDETLNQHAALLQKLLDHAPMPVFVKDLRGHFLMVNRMAEGIIGMERERIIGANEAELFPAEVVEVWRAHKNEVLARRAPLLVEESHPHKDGMHTYLSFRFPIFDSHGDIQALGGITTDITEHRHAEIALYKSQALLQGLLDHAPMVVFVKDLEGRYVLFNQQSTLVLQRSAEQLTGKTDSDLFPADVARLLQANDWRVLAAGHAIEFEEVLPLADGMRTFLSVKFPLYDEQGVISAIGSIATDITDRKQGEAALQQMTDDLQVANIQLARASTLKDAFLANMSHELRNPLNVILGLSEVLQEEIYGSVSDEQRTLLSNIEQSGHRLLEMINDILDLSKIEAGRAELHVVVVSAEDVCHVSLQSIRQRARKKHITISQTVANKWITFLADNRRLNQILSNLLDNAVKFTPEGGRIGLEVAVDEEQHMVHFTVWDTGIGIAPEGLDLLFQPFVQLDDKLSRRYEGAGLGLALVARLAEMHGGRVSVESELEKGSRFTVSLPWEPPEDMLYRQQVEETTPLRDDRPVAAKRHTAAHDETSRHPEPAHGPLDLPSFQAAMDADELAGLPLILLAEDNEEMVDMLRAYLEIKGYRVVVAFNGKDALELARETRPDLILMDIQMPRMDGLETTRRLRTDAELAHIPIIALTALVMPGDRERCLDAGADEYMIKPGSLKKVMQAINAHLQRDSGSS